MASMNSSVLACSYAISGAGGLELSSKASSVCCVAPSSCDKLPVIKAQAQKEEKAIEGRRAAVFGLAAALVATSFSSNANAGVIEEYLEKSKANKKVPFISEDLELECEGKDKFKCGSNVFWKW
uniref:Uncharacterized protein n=1 Tax=Chenopodium quinoa TaxID=63459 RepID=A0A803KX08_CHEQI